MVDKYPRLMSDRLKSFVSSQAESSLVSLGLARGSALSCARIDGCEIFFLINHELLYILNTYIKYKYFYSYIVNHENILKQFDYGMMVI